MKQVITSARKPLDEKDERVYQIYDKLVDIRDLIGDLEDDYNPLADRTYDTMKDFDVLDKVFKYVEKAEGIMRRYFYE